VDCEEEFDGEILIGEVDTSYRPEEQHELGATGFGT
jgi:hypothetical protein